MKNVLCVFFFLWGFTGILSAVDPVQLLYCVNKEVFEITSFENGLPKLDNKIETDSLNWDDREHGDWKVVGDLPSSLEYVWPSTAYQLKRISSRYGEAQNPKPIEVSMNFGSLEKSPWKNVNDSEDRFLIGWWANGQLVEVAVMSKKLEKRLETDQHFELTEDEKDGSLRIWLLKGGRIPAKRKDINELDHAAMGSDMESEFGVSKMKSLKASRKVEVLRAAAANGHSSLVKWLVEECRFPPTPKKVTARTALHSAAQNGRVDVVRYLVEAGAKLLIDDTTSRYPLNDAAENGHLNCLKLLIADAPKSRQDKFQYSRAFSVSMRDGHEEAAILLMDAGASYHIAEGEEGSAILKLFSEKMPHLAEAMLLKHKVEWKHTDKGYGFMHAIASYADVNLVEKFIEKGVPKGGETEKGIRPLDIAVGFGNVPAICWFLDNENEPTAPASKFDPLLYAIKSRKMESVECLIGYGFDVNTEKVEGISPMMQALLYGELEIALAIREAGGVWVMDSPHLDSCVTKAIELDSVPLLQDLLAQGWSEERELFDSVTLLDVAKFFNAVAIDHFLNNSEPSLVAENRVSLKELSQKPGWLQRVKVEYPTDMQRKFGTREVHLSAMLDRSGNPRLVRFKSDEPVAIKNIVQQAVMQWRFSAGAKEDNAVPVSLNFKLPLKAAMDPDSVFDMAVLTEHPEPISQVEPNYPFHLYKSSREGWVLLEFVIDHDGVVIDAKAIRSSIWDFEAPAINSIYRSRWKAGKVNGKPVAVRVRQKISFTLD